MQTLTRTCMVVIEDFDLMTTMDENMTWMETNTTIANFSSKC
jgi:hypothetical protein